MKSIRFLLLASSAAFSFTFSVRFFDEGAYYFDYVAVETSFLLCSYKQNN